MRIRMLGVLLLVTASGLGMASEGGETTSIPATLPSEVITFRWKIEGLQGFVARLFNLVPTAGEGVLEVVPAGPGRIVCQFRATSHQESADDHWTYRVEVNLDQEKTEWVSDSWHFRGRHKEKEYDLSSESALDIISGLHLMRLSPPTEARRITAWSDGKVYPVMVTPHGLEQREVNGRLLIVRHISVQGIREKGQGFFKAHWDSCLRRLWPWGDTRVNGRPGFDRHTRPPLSAWPFFSCWVWE